MNDSKVFESLIEDQNVVGVIGALEYDPDFPTLKANHRSYFAGDAHYKEVVPIQDEEIRFKIKQTYRLQFLKDVLARLLDDSTFSVFTSMIYFNQMSIVIALQNSQEYMSSLFRLFKEQSPLEKRRDAVKFVHQISLATKGFQSQQKKLTFTKLIAHGLFLLLEFALNDSNETIRMLGTELLLTVIDLDASLIRNYVQTPGQHAATFALMQTLVDLFFREPDIGLKSQAAEALKYMLDIGTLSMQDDTGRSSNQELENEVFVASFYTNCAPKLFDCIRHVGVNKTLLNKRLSLTDKATFELLCDLVTFCVRTHGLKCRAFTIERDLWYGISTLIMCPHQVIQLAALRCLKQALLLDDPTYVHHLAEAAVSESVVDVLIRMGNKNNLLNSACLEILSFIESGLKLSMSETMLFLVNGLVRSREAELKDGISYTDLGEKLLTLHGRAIEEEAIFAQQVMEERLQEETLKLVSNEESESKTPEIVVEESAQTTDDNGDDQHNDEPVEEHNGKEGHLKRRMRYEDDREHEESSPHRRLRLENSNPKASADKPFSISSDLKKSEKKDQLNDENTKPDTPTKSQLTPTKNEIIEVATTAVPEKKADVTASEKSTATPSHSIPSSESTAVSVSVTGSPTKKDRDSGSIKKTLVNAGKLVLGGLKKGSSKTSTASTTKKK